MKFILAQVTGLNTFIMFGMPYYRILMPNSDKIYTAKSQLQDTKKISIASRVGYFTNRLTLLVKKYHKIIYDANIQGPTKCISSLSCFYRNSSQIHNLLLVLESHKTSNEESKTLPLQRLPKPAIWQQKLQFPSQWSL